MKWLLLILFCLIVLNSTHKIYINIFSHSLPYGAYVMVKGYPQRGNYASSCLTQEIARYGIARSYLVQGNCDTGTVLVLKMIKGIPGDHFQVKNGLLELNGHSYPIMRYDSSARVLKSFYKEKEGVFREREIYFIK